MKQLQLISKNQRERTLKLLQDTKTKYGISVYLLMKKMLTVSILVDFLQNKYKFGTWITYEEFLRRNEAIVNAHYDTEYLRKSNGLLSPYFFAIPTYVIIQQSLQDVENTTIEHWERTLNEQITFTK